MSDAQKIHKAFSQDLDFAQVAGLLRAFEKLDPNDKGWIDERTAIDAAKDSENQSYDDVRNKLKAFANSSGQVDKEDYVKLIVNVRRQSKNNQTSADTRSQAPQHKVGHASKGSVSNAKTIHVGGTSSSILHSIDEDERTEFTRHINAVLAGDPDIGDRLPFPTDSFMMFDQCRDGLVLAKLINDSVPDTIDERVLNRPGKKIKTLNAFQENENNIIVIESAKGIGCSVVNIGSDDIKKGTEHLILGLIWQIIRRGLLNKIDIKLHPELHRLLETYENGEREKMVDFLKLSPEKILLRWFNYHLKAASSQPAGLADGYFGSIKNFTDDIKDSKKYTVLLAQIAPEYCDRGALKIGNDLQRAEKVLQNADKLGCRKFLTPSAIAKANQKLNLAFVANLFNNWPALDPITEEEKQEVEIYDATGDREARVYTLWLNSLDVNPVVGYLFEDLKDGTVLIQAYNKLIPGFIEKYNKRTREDQPVPTFRALENVNAAVEKGKKDMHFSLPGIHGDMIHDGSHTAILSLMWQLMRKNINMTVSALAKKLGKSEMTDVDILEWANTMSGATKTTRISGFMDQRVKSGVFFLDVLHGMSSSYVDYDLVTPGLTDDDAYMNARLSISIARKLGATIWLLPEDICSGSKLCASFVASLMVTNERLKKPKNV